MKEGGDGSGELAGERIGEVSDKDLRGDMSKAGVSEKDIEEMSKASKDNKMSELSEDGDSFRCKRNNHRPCI